MKVPNQVILFILNVLLVAAQGLPGLGEIESDVLGVLDLGGGSEGAIEYKECKSLLGCLDGPYDCIAGKCQPPRPGIDCVAEGSVPSTTSGPAECCYPFMSLEAGKPCEMEVYTPPPEDPRSCCPPMVTRLGKKCAFPDYDRCNNDAICTERAGGAWSKCCNAGTEKSVCRGYKDKCT
ncbi:hypothetical protein BC940DRAFT_315338 [Gongronella butleri]|nr:hypothetical protein BC940DRAFT_315338 [Gongronella butleri]